MVSEKDSDNFDLTACKMLKEYSTIVRKKKLKFEELSSKRLLAKTAGDDSGYNYFETLIDHEKVSFHRTKPVYVKLIRKVSQWLSHAETAPPGRQLELELRLDEFESIVMDTEYFYSMM